MTLVQRPSRSLTAATARLSTIAALASLLSLSLIGVAAAEPRHGLSIFGELKYPADFTHFDYVNPDAPKGGRLITMGTGDVNTFDSFNQFIVKGDAAQDLDLLFDSLMVRAQDEPDAVYGLIAKSADVAPDKMSVTFKLRPEAKFADGTQVTANDVVNTLNLLKSLATRPQYSQTLRDVEKAEALDPETVRYTFKGNLVRDLPVLVAQLPVLSKAYYTANPYDQTSLKPPLGSGPYRIKAFNPGSSITYERRPDYWAKDLPVNKGRFNFDEIRLDYYRDRTIELETLKSGGFDYREEFSSLGWATQYDIPAVRDGRLIKELIPDRRPSGAQGYFINTRRDKFKDPRVRAALDLVFDFEWSNKKLFFGLYKRTQSYFENSDMKAVGPPSPEELAVLEPYKDKLPPEVFGEPYTPPVTDGSGNNRANLKKARDLLISAGWKPDAEGKLRNDKGEQLSIEFLDFEAQFERITLPYVENLKRIGVAANWRLVDPAQYQQRLKSFDFDMTTQRFSLGLTPGIDMRAYLSCDAAKADGSFNLAGVCDPVVDALTDKVIAAKSRAELTTATRALDRVLRAGHYWVPHWYKPYYSVAYWNKFSRPAIQPTYDNGVVDTWWFDPQKAATLASGKAETQSTQQPAKQ
ncbi:MAG: extracellular solute-binding protein [Hyphomicrobium sp.]|uniref:extracellular solute-binding protein n=1 Tax=Hyphomicrobium sp. TaxID=82 RepID=UPI0039E6C8B4